MSVDRPFFLMVAGPNGAGKTTLTDKLRSANVDLGLYINADEIAAGLPGADDRKILDAQREAMARCEDCLARGIAFTFETVMSHPSKLDYLREARSRNFRTRLFFVGTEHPGINVDRVALRRRQGGHDVPVEKIAARYKRTMTMLYDAALLCDEGALFDNTSPTSADAGQVVAMQMMLVFQRDGRSLKWTPRVLRLANWANEYFVARHIERKLTPLPH